MFVGDPAGEAPARLASTHSQLAVPSTPVPGRVWNYNSGCRQSLAQLTRHTCVQSVLHSIARGSGGTQGGLVTSPAVTSLSPQAGQARLAATAAGAAWPRTGLAHPGLPTREGKRERLSCWEGWRHPKKGGAGVLLPELAQG